MKEKRRQRAVHHQAVRQQMGHTEIDQFHAVGGRKKELQALGRASGE
jgi:hypothetical protein